MLYKHLRNIHKKYNFFVTNAEIYGKILTLEIGTVKS